MSVKKITSSPSKYLPFGIIILLMILGGLFLLHQQQHHHKAPDVSYTALQHRIAADEVKSLEVLPESQAVQVTEKDSAVPEYEVGIPAKSGSSGLNGLISTAEAHGVIVSSKPISKDSGSSLLITFLRFLPTLIVFAILGAVAYSMGLLGNRFKVASATSDVSFSDVAGCGEAVEELEDVRSFLADPRRFEALGARVPKGVLLYGPPGTGKTLLAKAVANEAGIPFFPASGSEFVEMYAGLGARRVRHLFAQAKKQAPSIIFIDELDAVGSTRGAGAGDGASREADQTLVEILRQMDGFEVSEHPVIVIGATNRLQALDSALTRPGRFDRHIAIDPPDKRGRLDVLKVHARGKALDKDVDLENLAVQTSGMNGAELALLLNEAALLAARRKAGCITSADIDDAYFRVIAGAKKQHRSMNEEERRRVAYHETGHALVRELLKGSDVVHKISIIPRGASGGQTIYVSEEDVFLHSVSDLEDMLAALLAGRAAEEIIFKEISSGAADDLERASDLGEKMLSRLGMGDTLGLRVNLPDKITLSDIERQSLDTELKQLLADQYHRASALLSDHRKEMERIADALLEEETLDRPRFLELLDANPETHMADKPGLLSAM